MPNSTHLNVIVGKEALEAINSDSYMLKPETLDAMRDIMVATRHLGQIRFSSEDPDLIGKIIATGRCVPFHIGEISQVTKELMQDGLVDEYHTKDFPASPIQNPEFHIHFDVWGWRDSTGAFCAGIPRILEQELQGIVHRDSFNPFYSVLGADGQIRASERFRETPFLLTSGLTCKRMEAMPEEARMAKIGFDELNRRIKEINEKHNIELVGYTELELISVVRKLPHKPVDEGYFNKYFVNSQEGPKSVLKLKMADLNSGFKTCEFHFKLGKGYDPRIAQGLIDIGLINAAMPPEPDGSFTPYFTMQGRSLEIRDQLATYITMLARSVGGFGAGARIQLETIVGHKFFGREFAPSKHLPKITTGYDIIAGRERLNGFLESSSSQTIVTGIERATIAETASRAKVEESYRQALRSLQERPAGNDEIAETLARLDAWDDNPDLKTKDLNLGR